MLSVPTQHTSACPSPAQRCNFVYKELGLTAPQLLPDLLRILHLLGAGTRKILQAARQVTGPALVANSRLTQLSDSNYRQPV